MERVVYESGWSPGTAKTMSTGRMIVSIQRLVKLASAQERVKRPSLAPTSGSPTKVDLHVCEIT